MVLVTRDDVEDYDLIADYLSEDSDHGGDPSEEKLTSVEERKKWNSGLSDSIIIGGLPVAGSEKLATLESALRKTLGVKLASKNQPSISPTKFEFSLNKEGTQSLGGVCITFKDSQEAQVALNALQGAAFGKKHVLRGCKFDDFDILVDQQKLPGKAIDPLIRNNLFWWLKDSEHRGMEQFAIRFKTENKVCWLDPVGREPIALRGQDTNRLFTRGKICWSPMGTFFCTFHNQGLKLFGGPELEVMARIEHRRLGHILFSPQEDYLITSCEKAADDQPVQLWRLVTKELITSLPIPPFSPTAGTLAPFYVWSYNGDYLASRVVDDPGTIAIYAAPGFSKALELQFEVPKLVAGTAVQQQDHIRFAWSPTSSHLAVFVPEKGETPCRVVVYEIPSKTEIASKNIYSAKEAEIHWHPRGWYIALSVVIVKKTGKKSKKEVAQVEIFRLKDKNVPVDSIQLDSKKLRQIAWEPTGHRLALIVREEPVKSQELQFYSVTSSETKKETSLVASMEVYANVNFIKWSPIGSNFIAAVLGGEGTLIFASLTESNKIDTYRTDEHFQVNELTWDHSGRYLCTAVATSLSPGAASYRFGRDAGFQIWTFQGRLLYAYQTEEFYIFQWRPRPPSLLSAEKEREVYRSLKDYSKGYDKIDEAQRTEKREAFQKAKQSTLDAFMQTLKEAENWLHNHPMYEDWKRSQAQLDNSFEYEIEERITEEQLSISYDAAP